MSLRQQKWTWRECQPHFCMAEQDEAAAEALRGMNEAPDPPHAPGNQFQHDMGQSESPAPAVSGGQGDAQTSTELTEKDMSARAIHYGCPESASNLKRWAGPYSSKPSLKELRAEVIRRDPTARPSWWGGAQDWSDSGRDLLETALCKVLYL